MTNELDLLYRLYNHLLKQDNYTKLSISKSLYHGSYCTISNDYCFYQGWGVDIEEAIYDLIDVYVGVGCKDEGETLYIELSKAITKQNRKEKREEVLRLTEGQPDVDKILEELGLNEDE